MKRLAIIALLIAPAAIYAQPGEPSVFVAYFWHAKPGQADAYNEYIRTVAVPIDEDARRAGAFEEVRTVRVLPAGLRFLIRGCHPVLARAADPGPTR